MGKSTAEQYKYRRIFHRLFYILPTEYFNFQTVAQSAGFLLILKSGATAVHRTAKKIMLYIYCLFGVQRIRVRSQITFRKEQVNFMVRALRRKFPHTNDVVKLKCLSLSSNALRRIQTVHYRPFTMCANVLSVFNGFVASRARH